MPTLTELYQSVCEYKEELQGRTLSKATVRAFKDSYKSFVHFLQVRDRADCMPTEVDKTLLEDYRLLCFGTWETRKAVSATAYATCIRSFARHCRSDTFVKTL